MRAITRAWLHEHQAATSGNDEEHRLDDPERERGEISRGTQPTTTPCFASRVTIEHRRLLAFSVKLMMMPFFDLEIIGAENLDQAKTPSAVMVANHQSAVDSLIFGYLWRHNFRVRLWGEREHEQHRAVMTVCETSLRSLVFQTA